MLLVFGLSAMLLAAPLPIAAQPSAATSAVPPSGPQAEIQRAATLFGQCISAGIQNLSASATPEPGAAAVLRGCAAQRDALTEAVNAMIATVPQAERAPAHAQFESQMRRAESQIADAIRQRRGAPATPAH